MSPSALRRQIGQLLIAGFNGHEIPPEMRSMAKEFGLGGVILFARNIVEPEQVAEVAFEAVRLQPELPAWVSVDQEGGRVARLKAPFTEWPPAANIFPVMAIPARTHISSCRWWSIPRTACAASSSCRSKPPSPRASRRS